jgi:hypothetical protein
VIFALLLACNPFENNAPKLQSVNGEEYHLFFGFADDSVFLVEPGTDVEVVVDAKDPEGRDLRIWWPLAPAGWEFDPDETTGVWHVPEDPLPVWSVELLIQDTNKHDPRISRYDVPFHIDGFDSGIDTGGYTR